MHQYAWHLRGVYSMHLKGFDDHLAGFPFVITVDFRVGHQAGTGDGAVELVGVGGAGCWNRLPGLRPDGRVARVGVNDTAERGKCLIQQAVGWGIR